MLPTFGQRLKAARDARGLSLADAAHETRVPAQRMQPLESDTITAFGSIRYVRSFLKLYSDFLSVDACEVYNDLSQAKLGGERRKPTERLSESAYSPRVHSIKTLMPAGIAVFLCILAFAGIYGKNVAIDTVAIPPSAVEPAIEVQPAIPLEGL